MSGFFHSEYTLSLYFENFHISMQRFSSQGSKYSIKKVTPNKSSYLMPLCLNFRWFTRRGTTDSLEGLYRVE